MFLQLLLSGIHLQRAKRSSVIADKRQNSHRWRRGGWPQSWWDWRHPGQCQGDEGGRSHQDVRSQRESSRIQCQLQGSPHSGENFNNHQKKRLQLIYNFPGAHDLTNTPSSSLERPETSSEILLQWDVELWHNAEIQQWWWVDKPLIGQFISFWLVRCRGLQREGRGTNPNWELGLPFGISVKIAQI